MGEVLLFPQKKRIPGGIQKRLDEIAKEYVEALQCLIVLLDVDISNQSEYEEILDMVQESFLKSILLAVNSLEED